MTSLHVNILIQGMSKVYYPCWTAGLWPLLLTNLKLAWKAATLLALVIARCSDLTLLCIDNQHLLLQHYAAIFIPASGGKGDQPGHQ